MIAYPLSQPEDAMPTVVCLRERLETVRHGEIERVRGRLGRLSSEQESAIESLTCGIINRVLHPAITVLKTATESESTYLLDRIRRIFKLGEKHKVIFAAAVDITKTSTFRAKGDDCVSLLM